MRIIENAMLGLVAALCSVRLCTYVNKVAEKMLV